MTTREIHEAIISKGLYTFHAQDPYGVVKSQIRRHCVGIDFSAAHSTALVQVVYYMLMELLRENRHKKVFVIASDQHARQEYRLLSEEV